jgi:quinol monooxygenase YgiN
LNNHGASVSQTKSIVEETLSSVCPSIEFKVLEPTLGFIQRSNQTIPISAKTTIVRYKTTPGDRGKVIDSCGELFRFAEEEEMDVYSLAIMNDVGLDDEFVILERYESAEAEQRHFESDRVVQCLGEVKGMILEHESVGYEILDV